MIYEQLLSKAWDDYKVSRKTCLQDNQGNIIKNKGKSMFSGTIRKKKKILCLGWEMAGRN